MKNLYDKIAKAAIFTFWVMCTVIGYVVGYSHTLEKHITFSLVNVEITLFFAALVYMVILATWIICGWIKDTLKKD